MTLDGFLRLAAQSVTNPREVAALLLSIRPNREALWTAFALVVVLNALLFSASILVDPSSVPPFLSSPVAFLVMQGGALAASILALTWVGRMFGGRAKVEEIALLLIWMQGLRVLVQAATLLLVPVSLSLAGLLTMVATGLGVWIAVNFIDEAHGLGGLLRALAVLVLGMLAMAFAVSILLTLAGVSPEGMSDYV
ncbi:YIP1 family protein [Mameliella sediminis]|uniref:YIP1 family protein n=1 Tax=Mameliella sediminis TaxID=2836866 RepID=UPI001C44EA6B|nr:YIP1 family protein [Mameliella sediminis]